MLERGAGAHAGVSVVRELSADFIASLLESIYGFSGNLMRYRMYGNMSTRRTLSEEVTEMSLLLQSAHRKNIFKRDLLVDSKYIPCIQYHGQHCCLHVVEQFGTLLIYLAQQNYTVANTE